MKRSTPYILPLILVALSLKCFHWVATDTWSGLRSTKWPAAEGVILSTDMRLSPGRFGDPMWSPLVRYRFTVDGITHNGATFSYPTRRTGSKDTVQKILAAYPDGSTTNVHYNPNDPAQSCLKPGPDYFFIAIISAVGILLLGLGAWWIVRIKQSLNT